MPDDDAGEVSGPSSDVPTRPSYGTSSNTPDRPDGYETFSDLLAEEMEGIAGVAGGVEKPPVAVEKTSGSKVDFQSDKGTVVSFTAFLTRLKESGMEIEIPKVRRAHMCTIMTEHVS